MTPNGWWITGGQVEAYNLDKNATQLVSSNTTEFLFRNFSMSTGPELPEAVEHHCAVQLDANHTLIVGGVSYHDQEVHNRSDAFIYDWSSSSWCETEPLNLQRKSHACVLLPDKRVLIVGGITNEVDEASEEVLDLGTMKWTLRTQLPVEAV